MTLRLDEYVRSDATALARLVGSGDVSAAELLSLAVAQLERVNPIINAVHRPMLQEAAARVLGPLRGPLAGVPLLIKDAGQDYAGLSTSNGSRGFRSIIPKHRWARRSIQRRWRRCAMRQTCWPRLDHLVEDRPDYDGIALARCFLELYLGQVAATLAEARAAGACSADFELTTRLLEALGNAASAGTYVGRHRRWNEFARALGTFHHHYDLYLTPTVAFPPVEHGAARMPGAQQAVMSLLLNSGLLGILSRLGWMEATLVKLAQQSLSYVPFTQLTNLTGTPAMSVPLYWTADGLPLGVQLHGPFGSEAMLLQLASLLEAAQSWTQRLPNLALPA